MRQPYPNPQAFSQGGEYSNAEAVSEMDPDESVDHHEGVGQGELFSFWKCALESSLTLQRIGPVSSSYRGYYTESSRMTFPRANCILQYFGVVGSLKND